MSDKMSNAVKAERRRFADPKPQRTPAEQLAVLDARLGVGVGAARERARLTALLPQAKRTRVRKASADLTVRPSMTEFADMEARRKANAAEAYAFLLAKNGESL